MALVSWSSMSIFGACSKDLQVGCPPWWFHHLCHLWRRYLVGWAWKGRSWCVYTPDRRERWIWSEAVLHRLSCVSTLTSIKENLKTFEAEFYFRGRKAIEGSTLGMMIQSPPPRSHGTMPIDVRRIHEFGYFCLRRMAKYLEHRGAPHNYSATDAVGEILVRMHSDLRLCIQMYSPTHGRTSR